MTIWFKDFHNKIGFVFSNSRISIKSLILIYLSLAVLVLREEVHVPEGVHGN